MASFSYLPSYTISCSSTRDGHVPNIQKLNSINFNGISSMLTPKVELVNAATTGTVTPVADHAAENGYITKEQIRQNIPTKKQLVDTYRQGRLVEEGVGYRQTVVVRSYEVGPDKTATIESIFNLLQETALNHVWMSGLLGDGFGATHGMMRNNLIWVVSRMQAQVDHYPIWGEIMEIDTWVGASGKNGMRRDWLLRSQATGLVFARATSTWVMMNQQTRRLSKMPDEVRAEISPWFIDKQTIKEETPEKIEKLDDKAKYVNSDLKPKRRDLDMNHHVNNVKYVRWMLEVNSMLRFLDQIQFQTKIIWISLVNEPSSGHQLNSHILVRKANIEEDWVTRESLYLDTTWYFNFKLFHLQAIPDQFLENHQLSSIELEYRRECGSSDKVQSLCKPHEDGILEDKVEPDNNIGLRNSYSLAPGILQGNGLLGILYQEPLRYTHLLQIIGGTKNEEIVRGRTTWKAKLSALPFST